jgi:hypothetical protein
MKNSTPPLHPPGQGHPCFKFCTRYLTVMSQARQFCLSTVVCLPIFYLLILTIKLTCIGNNCLIWLVAWVLKLYIADNWSTTASRLQDCSYCSLINLKPNSLQLLKFKNIISSLKTWYAITKTPWCAKRDALNFRLLHVLLMKRVQKSTHFVVNPFEAVEAFLRHYKHAISTRNLHCSRYICYIYCK